MEDAAENYEEKEERAWYAMYAYKNELRAKEQLDESRIENFIPMRYIVTMRQRKKTRLLVPAISNLIFVHASRSILTEFKQKHSYLQYITQKIDQRREVIIVPEAQMQAFIKIAEKCEEELLYFKPEEISLSRGTKVRVHGGPFDGIEGVLLKVKGKRNKRIVVKIPGVTAIAATYIEPDLIEIIA